MPTFGKIPVTVPGAPSTWAKLSERFGKLPFEQLFEPAIRYAEEGYPISPTLGFYWESAFKRFNQTFNEDIFKHWFDTFAPKGRAPKIGEIWSSKGKIAEYIKRNC